MSRTVPLLTYTSVLHSYRKKLEEKARLYEQMTKGDFPGPHKQHTHTHTLTVHINIEAV